MRAALIGAMLCWTISAQTETRTFRGVKELTVSNVNGPVEIAGGAGDAVELEAVREVKADDAEERSRADREVKLVAEDSAGKVEIYIDYPRDSRRRHYSVKYSFRLRVPSGVKLDGRTVNGPISARYSRNPTADVKLETVNGSVDTTFAAGLSADVRGKTLNGGVYSDFDVKALPQKVSTEQVNGMKRYRTEGTSFRIGAGGPAFEFRTINGNIFIRSNQK